MEIPQVTEKTANKNNNKILSITLSPIFPVE
jgi:hypothetical protein